MLDMVQIAYDTYFGPGVVLLGGDFNAQISSNCNRRAGVAQNIRGNYLEAFLTHNNMYSLLSDNICTGPLYTYWSDNNSGVSSQIDHFTIANDHSCQLV